jgi:hypothetical protein
MDNHNNNNLSMNNHYNNRCIDELNLYLNQILCKKNINIIYIILIK